MSAPCKHTSVFFVSVLLLHSSSITKYTSRSGILAKRRSRMRPGRFVEIFPLTAFLVSTSCGQTRVTGGARAEAETEKGIRGSTTRDQVEKGNLYALFFFLQANTDHRGRSITKDLSICQFRRFPAESEKTTVSNAFHYCTAWRHWLVKKARVCV